MKLGKKGFMLAEVVVVAVVIATVLVTLYTALNNISSAYETRNKYYDVDSLFAAIEVNEILLRNNYLEKHISDDLGIYLRWRDNDITYFESFYYNRIDDEIFSYFTPYNKEKILTLKSYNNETTETFNEYLDYLSNNLDFDDDYDYMIIVERREGKDVDNCYYYALKLKY